MRTDLKKYTMNCLMDEANYIMKNNATIYQTSRALGIPPSTVWWHMTQYLPQVAPEFAKEVYQVIFSHSKNKGANRSPSKKELQHKVTELEGAFAEMKLRFDLLVRDNKLCNACCYKGCSLINGAPGPCNGACDTTQLH